MISISTACITVASVSLFWHGLCIVAAWRQELNVGWSRVQRSGRILLYFTAMFSVMAVLQFAVIVCYLVRGQQAACKLAQRILTLFFSRCGQLMWGPIAIEGAEHLPPGDEACIYVANHQSSIDMVAIYILPNSPHVVGIGKSSMRCLPGLGVLMHMSGGIFVSRGKKGTMSMLVENGCQRLRDGLSIGVAPQGTRNIPRAGKPLLPFKIGAFALAVESKVRIVPFTIIYPSDFMSACPAAPGLKF